MTTSASFDWSGTSCLVIGGAGNLGGQLVRLLLEQGAIVSSFDLVPYAGPGDVRSFTGDICDGVALQEAMDKTKVVFHTASIIDIRPVPGPNMERVNVAGTHAVVQACKAAGIERLVYTSTMEVVSGTDLTGNAQRTVGVDESAPIPVKHHLPYAASKAAAEQLVLAAHCAELRTCSIRPGYIMGEGCIGLRIEMRKASQRAGYYIGSKVPARLSTVDSKNCAFAHIRAAERIEHKEVGGNAFFIRDFEANVVDMTVQCFAGTSINVLFLPLWMAYMIAFVLDRFERLMHAIYNLVGMQRDTSQDAIDIRAVGLAWHDIIVSDKRARELLDYAPRVSPEDCLSAAAQWCISFYADLVKK